MAGRAWGSGASTPPSRSARTWGSRAGLPWCDECQGARLGTEISPLSSPPVPLPSLWDRSAPEVLNPSGVGMCCWAGLCPTPGHWGCPHTCPHGGSLGGFCCLQLREDAQRVSPRGPLCGSRRMLRGSPAGTPLPEAPGRCSARALLPCPAVQSRFQVAWRCSHQCHRSKRLTQRFQSRAAPG